MNSKPTKTEQLHRPAQTPPTLPWSQNRSNSPQRPSCRPVPHARDGPPATEPDEPRQNHIIASPNCRKTSKSSPDFTRLYTNISFSRVMTGKTGKFRRRLQTSDSSVGSKRWLWRGELDRTRHRDTKSMRNPNCAEQSRAERADGRDSWTGGREPTSSTRDVDRQLDEFPTSFCWGGMGPPSPHSAEGKCSELQSVVCLSWVPTMLREVPELKNDDILHCSIYIYQKKKKKKRSVNHFKNIGDKGIWGTIYLCRMNLYNKEA